MAKPPLSVVVKYTGKVREIRSEKLEFLKNYASIIQNSSFFNLYQKEIEILEQGKPYWIPVQKEILPYLPKELKVGQEFTVYTRYFGVPRENVERIYLMIDFIADVQKKLPKKNCFTDNLLGIVVGKDLKPTLKHLSQKYGPLVANPMMGQSKHYVFKIDPNFNTLLILGDAGAGYRKKIYTIQISGPPNPNLNIFKNLKLGSTPSHVQKILGKPINKKETGQGYSRLSFENTNCSVELKKGKLASFLIADDPNYFSN